MLLIRVLSNHSRILIARISDLQRDVHEGCKWTSYSSGPKTWYCRPLIENPPFNEDYGSLRYI